jgi:hypothetical protein
MIANSSRRKEFKVVLQHPERLVVHGLNGREV